MVYYFPNIIPIISSQYCYLVQTPVEVLSVLRNEDEIHSGYSGDNVKLKLKGIEEEVRQVVTVKWTCIN